MAVAFGSQLTIPGQSARATCGQSILLGIKWALEERCVEAVGGGKAKNINASFAHEILVSSFMSVANRQPGGC